MNNNKKWIIIGVVALVILIIVGWVVGAYNSLVTLDETVDEKWANVQTAYQRRADLIPNLVETVQGAADFESETQTEIAAVRTSAVAAQQAMASASTPGEVTAASAQVESAIAGFSGLNINVERYPELRAIENFLSLQDELAGTENRIKVERDIYNQAVRNYNVKVRKFPSNIIAGMFGFEKDEPFFEADEGADEVVKVNF
ncbi:MAG: LemA family protein [Nanoarchaeota archaeon]|nr:LemA family protein [DPANN group archaeon]MBL7116880.1 LemA family protein [Nanoarchaeota archaeon]